MTTKNKYEEALHHLILKLSVALRNEYLSDENITKYLEDLSELIENNKKLDQALDKTCDMLNTFDLAYRPGKEKKENEWKEWALNND